MKITMPANGATAQSPFKFLEAYQKEDAQAFFGRDREVRELFERIYLSNIILLYGASGTGKSSLIRCGLANQFEESDWLPIFVRRNGNILASLHRALDRRALSTMEPGLDLEPPSAATVDGWIDVFERLGLQVINRRSDSLTHRKSSPHV